MKKISIIMALAACLGVSCSNDNEEWTDASEIRINAEIPGSTRVLNNAFEQDDQIGLYAVPYAGNQAGVLQIGGNYLNNERWTYSGKQWFSARKLYWSDVPCDFYAFYPYQELNSIDQQVFEIQTNQNRAETSQALSGYEASDILWAKTEKVTKEQGKVDLSFKHMMSKVVVKIVKGPKFEGEIPDDITTHIYNTATTAAVNFRTGSLEKYVFSPKKTVTMKKIDNQTFEAIVVPQNIERNTPLVEITMGGIAYLLDYSLSFRPGYQYQINVTLNTSPDQEKIEISIDGSIEGDVF